MVVKNLNHYFGEGNLRQALFDINLGNIDMGEIVIMTGPSGSRQKPADTHGLRSAFKEGSLKILGQNMWDSKRS